MSQTLRVGLALSALAACFSTTANAQERNARPSESTSDQYCQPFALDPYDDAPDPDLSMVQEAIRACMIERERELSRSDERTRTLSRVSAVGGAGTLVSTLTSAAVGTTNAWAAIGLAPIIADDVQQRRRVSAIRHDYLARLDQLQCRSQFLSETTSALEQERATLLRKIEALETLIGSALDRPQPRGPTNPSREAYNHIVEEALRVVEESSATPHQCRNSHARG